MWPRSNASAVDALRKCLDDPMLLGEYLKEYWKERCKAEASARKSRAKIERQLADLSRIVDRVIDAIADGTISKGQAAAKIAELRATEDRSKAELAAADSDTMSSTCTRRPSSGTARTWINWPRSWRSTFARLRSDSGVP